MMIYRDTDTAVTFSHSFPGPLVATVYRDGLLILTSDSLAPIGGVYSLPLTFRETQYDGILNITWTGVDGSLPFVRTTEVEVVTPLVSLSTLRTLFTETNWTDAELLELEKSVRLGIEAYTKQSFGQETGTKTVTGTGESRISLPSRLETLNTVTGGPVGYFDVSSDGWSLYIHNKNFLTVKEAPPEDFESNTIWTGDGLSGGVIYVPDSYWRMFRLGASYEIDGVWGYSSVPSKVQEAAQILAHDYASPDSLYRDRFLKTMKAGDWSLGYDPGAFRGTGNPRVDALLESYRREKMVII